MGGNIRDGEDLFPKKTLSAWSKTRPLQGLQGIDPKANHHRRRHPVMQRGKFGKERDAPPPGSVRVRPKNYQAHLAANGPARRHSKEGKGRPPPGSTQGKPRHQPTADFERRRYKFHR